MMNVLGSFAVGTLEQRLLVEGARLEMPPHRFLPRILQRARVGDLMWVKEPWFLYESRQFGPQNIREAVPGNIAQGLVYPARIKHIRHQLRLRTMGALTLAREDSRATLEILSLDVGIVTLGVHMKQVDAYMEARAA